VKAALGDVPEIRHFDADMVTESSPAGDFLVVGWVLDFDNTEQDGSFGQDMVEAAG
jgi:hypothetical protein